MGFTRIVFEYPVGWTDVDSDPLALQHLRCLETMRRAAKEMGLDFDTKSSLRMADFAQRFAPKDALLISVHTVGVSKNVARLKESYLPGYYYFDRMGYSGWSELAFNGRLQLESVSHDSGDVISIIGALREQKIKGNLSKYPQEPTCSNINASNASSPYIFLPLQTSDDLVARLSMVNQLELAGLLAKKVDQLGHGLIIKRHPLCNDQNIDMTLKELTRRYRCVSISNDSVNSLIKGAMAVVTVNSGVGFEAILMGVPVIAAGTSDYSFAVPQIHNKGDIEQIEKLIQRYDHKKLANFTYYFLRNYCLREGDVANAKRFLEKWMSDDYSSMYDLDDYIELLLADIQIYLSGLELIRRRMVSLPERRCSKVASLMNGSTTYPEHIKSKIAKILSMVRK